MKNLILPFISFFSLTLKAQTYIPMPLEDGMMWRAFGIYSSFEHYDEDKINGDTIFVGKAYKKIHRNSYSAPTTLTPYVPASASFYIRQDTMSKKVFLCNGIKDTLLYDFNLQIGDTIHGIMLGYKQNLGLDTIRIASIDSILLNGIYHKRFNSTPVEVPFTGTSTYTYIEGIGSISGPLSTCFKFECGYLLICVGKTYNQSLYPDSTFNCIYATPINDISLQNKVQVFPNPSSDFIKIHAIENVFEVKITNMLGHVLYYNNTYKDNEEIDIKKYPVGVYSIQLLFGSQLLVTRKFCKE